MEYELEPDESVSRAVKRLIAHLEECHPSKLGTLQQAVDIGELEESAESTLGDHEERPKPMLFRYCGYFVEVRSDQKISIAN